MNSEELAQLRLQYHDLGERIKVGEAMAKKEALQNAKDSMTAAGLTDAEIAAHFSKVRKPSSVSGTKVPVKYRDRATNSTWTGRGKAPTWFSQKRLHGGDIEQLR
ncbi:MULTISPECIES: H-NS histone family protein [Delftia]|uniref:H-NS histone family protein n=1 Tax=Delftia TaxID=80865 RepID=UPI0012455FE7|nr:MULTISPECIES: H-NS histone family protein [Delftia]KAA9177565.1 H-NS histone family protein [Delftia sp. BR1]MDC2859089.1 H-NS histone family protein [Delftia sp. DT-2]WQM80366.1 H-NS histone family protein [Delftia tsuruhatensis]